MVHEAVRPGFPLSAAGPVMPLRLHGKKEFLPHGFNADAPKIPSPVKPGRYNAVSRPAPALDKILVCNTGGPQFNEGSIRCYVRRHIPPGSCRNIYIIFRDSGQILIGPGSGLQRKLYRFLHLQGHQEFLQQIPSAGPSL